MWIAKYYDTDGYTYGCDTVLGIYETRAAADERCLTFHAKYRPSEGLENFTVEELVLGDWE